MKTIVVSLAILLASGAALAEPKPVLCTSWDVLRGNGRVVAVCTDRKTPVMLTRWTEVELPAEPKSAVRRAIVGWR